jgi:hypothetical protein
LPWHFRTGRPQVLAHCMGGPREGSHVAQSRAPGLEQRVKEKVGFEQGLPFSWPLFAVVSTSPRPLLLT